MLEAVGYVVLGLVLLMVPGFLFSTVIYPKVENLDFWARMGVSLGLGAMVAAIVGYVISIPGVSTLSLGPFVMTTSIVCVVLAIIAYLRGGLIILSAYAGHILKIFRRPKTKQEPQTKTTEETRTTV